MIYTNGFNRNNVEKIIFLYSGLWGKESIERFHPTQKPVELLKDDVDIEKTTKFNKVQNICNDGIIYSCRAICLFYILIIVLYVL